MTTISPAQKAGVEGGGGGNPWLKENTPTRFTANPSILTTSNCSTSMTSSGQIKRPNASAKMDKQTKTKKIPFAKPARSSNLAHLPLLLRCEWEWEWCS